MRYQTPMMMEVGSALDAIQYNNGVKYNSGGDGQYIDGVAATTNCGLAEVDE